MAVLGATVKTRGAMPLLSPFQPSVSRMILNASDMPRAFRIRGSELEPRVCSSVCPQHSNPMWTVPVLLTFATSSGVVTAAATAPATPPLTQCVKGE